MTDLERALAAVDDSRLAELATAMIDIASPTGEELRLAEHLVVELERAGLEASLQKIDADQANAVGRLPGTGDGPSLLLYAPIDTLTTGDPEEDLPWVGPELRPDLLPRSVSQGDLITGLGAGNPKGHGACIIAAAEAVARTAGAQPGDLLVGLGAGGMPTNRRGAGHGRGCRHMVDHGYRATEAVIAKPGWSVSWEEVGLVWFEVRVAGTHVYVGSRHRLPYRNPIVEMARVIEAIERWAAFYTTRHTDGLVAPQVNIGAIDGGWPGMPAVSSALSRLFVDVRVSPRTTTDQVAAEFGGLMDELRSQGIDLGWDQYVAIPGSHTPESSPVIVSTIGAWEAVEGRAHVPVTGTSGSTDANILRNAGIPTARVGMPKVTGIEDFQLGMNTVDVSAMRRLTELLIRVIMDRRRIDG